MCSAWDLNKFHEVSPFCSLFLHPGGFLDLIGRGKYNHTRKSLWHSVKQFWGEEARVAGREEWKSSEMFSKTLHISLVKAVWYVINAWMMLVTWKHLYLKQELDAFWKNRHHFPLWKYSIKPDRKLSNFPFIFCFPPVELANVRQCWDTSYDVKRLFLVVPYPHSLVSGLNAREAFSVFLLHGQTCLMCNGLFSCCFGLVYCKPRRSCLFCWTVKHTVILLNRLSGNQMVMPLIFKMLQYSLLLLLKKTDTSTNILLSNQKIV